MAAVANVGVLANGYTVNRVLSAIAAPEFAKSPVLPGLIYAEDLPSGAGTKVKSFKRQGGTTIISASASVSLAEATALAIQAPREDTSVDATAAKCVRVDGLSIEAQRFGTTSKESIVGSQARAIARAVDNQGLALFSTVTNIVTSTGPLLLDDLDEAQLKIVQGECPDINKTLNFVGSARAMRHLKKDIRDAGGAAMGNERFLSIFDGAPQLNGFYGSLPGISLYHTSGLEETGSNYVQCLFHPDWAFAGMFDTSISVMTTEIGSGGLYTELVSYYFWAMVLWCAAAACEVQSDVA